MGTPILQFYWLDPGEKYAHTYRLIPTLCITRFKRWIGKRNPAFEGVGSRSFLVAQKEDSRSPPSRSPNFLFRVEERRERGEREREKRNTKGTTLPRARIALSRTSWIARKETVLSRRKVLSIHAVSTSVAIKPCPPRDQLFLETLVNEKEWID